MGIWDRALDFAEATAEWGGDTFDDPWDRTWRVGSGFAGGFKEVGLMAVDMGKGLVTEESRNLENALWDSFTSHGAKALERTIGPNEGLGALFGGAPSEARSQVREMFTGLDWIRDNGISQPLSTLFIVPSAISADSSFGQWDRLFEGQTYAKSWKLANDTSPGQAIILGLLVDNIFDPQEVNREMGSSYFNFASGSLDFLFAMKFDPLVIAGRVAKLGKVGAAAGRLEDLNQVRATEHSVRLARRAATGETLGPMDQMKLGLYKRSAGFLNNHGVNAFVNYNDYPSLTARLGRRFAARAINPGTSQADIIKILKTDQTRKFADNIQFMQSQIIGRYPKTRLMGRPLAEAATPANFHEMLAGEIRDTYLSSPRYRAHDVNSVATDLAKAADDRESLENMIQFYFYGDTRAAARQHGLLQDAMRREADISERMTKLRAYETLEREVHFKSRARAMTDMAADQLFNDIVSNYDYPFARKRALLRSFSQRQDYAKEMRIWMETQLSSAMDDVNGYNNAFRIAAEEAPDALTRSADDLIRAADLPAPSVRHFDQWRYSVKQSDWWQKDFTSRPIRLFTNMTPHNMIDHSRSDADVQLARVLEQSGLSQTTKTGLRGRYQATRDIDERHAIFDDVTTAMFRNAAEEAGVDEETIIYLLHALQPARMNLKILGKKFSIKDPDGIAMITSNSPTGIKAVGVIGDERSLFSYVPNMRQLRKQLRRRATIESRFKTVYQRLKNTNYVFMNQSPGAGGTKFSSMRSGLKMKGDPKDLGFVGGVQKSSADLLGFIQGIWAPAVIIDPNWTLRVVMMDEQVRMGAKFLATLGWNNALLMAKQGAKNWVYNTIDREYKIPQWMGYTHKNITAKTDIRAAVMGAALGWGAAGGTEDPEDALLMMIAGAVGNTSLARIFRGMKKAPFDFGIRPLGFERAFGNSTDRMNEYEVLNSAGHSSMTQQFWANEGIARSEIESWSHWGKDIRVKSPDDLAAYQASWEYMGNSILREDPLGRQILRELMTEEARRNPAELFSLVGPRERVMRWMMNTTEGRAARRALPSRGRYIEDTETWINEAVEEMSRQFRYGGRGHVTGPYHDLENMRRILGKEDVEFSSFLRHNRDDITNLPAINAARKREVLGNQYSMASVVDKAVGTGMDFFGRLPTDNLSRNPSFAIFYEMEVARLHQIYTQNGTRLSRAAVTSIESRARNYALNQTKELLYDLAERSEFAEMMRFIMPFYPAMQEVMTRYASLAVENPVFAAHLAVIWRGRDENPYFHKDPSSGTEYFRFRLPSWAASLSKHTFFGSAFDSQGTIDLPIKSLNMITQGPGFGPFVQVPLAAMAKGNPTMEESLGFMFPFGIPGGSTGDIITQSFTPGYVKRAISIYSGDSDDSMASARQHIILTHLVDISLGKRDPIDFDDPAARALFLQETEEEAKEFMMLRLVSTLFAPASPRFGGAYQPYIDAFRVLQEKNPSTAEELFLAEFGDEFFPMTQSLTKTNNGMPSTIEGLAAEAEFADIITQYPEWAGVITGLRGGGSVKFSRLAYEKQLQTPLYEGGRTMQRERFTPEELIQDNRNQLTWTRFSQQMDIVDALMEERGLPNLRVKAAEDLATYKRFVIQMLGMENEAWMKEYMSSDPLVWPNKIEAFTAMANHPRMINRPDIEGLKQYLDMRRQTQLMLESEGIGRLDSTAAMIIRDAWDTSVQQLVNKNLLFSDLYHRYLENDPVIT